VRPKRSLGQNFLVDPNIQRKIVDAVGAGPDDVVVEIGPGRGALTDHFAGSVRGLVAVELDDDLARALQDRYAQRDEVEIRHADALALDFAALDTEPERLRVVGNIPYNITTPLLFHLLDQSPLPARIVLMVQKEVADRIVAPPGNKTYGALSVGVRTSARVERLFNVSRSAFRPVPDVASSVISLEPFRPPRLTAAQHDDVRTLTRVAFGQRRKQLQKILRTTPEYDLDTADIESLEGTTGLDLTARPETLSPDQFIALARALRWERQP